MLSGEVHVFDNGVKVFKRHLLPVQLKRYSFRNVHEAEEEDIFTALVSGISSRGVYVDIGCAIGYYAILARRMRPDIRIMAIEPLDQHREYFIENIELNGLTAGDFEILDCAISAINGDVAFLANGYGSMICNEADEAPTSTIKTVSSLTLDDIVGKIACHVDLCQMDVQGVECDVLHGAAESMRAGKIKKFLIGTHGENIHRDCLGILKDAGYSIDVDICFPARQPDGIIMASSMLG